MGLDLPNRHASGVEREDLVVESCPAGLVLRDKLRLEAAVSVPGDINRQLTKFALERLLALAVTGVATGINDGLILVVAKVVWAEPGSVDTDLSELRVLELYRTHVAQC